MDSQIGSQIDSQSADSTEQIDSQSAVSTDQMDPQMDSQKRYPGIQLGGVVRDMPHCLELDTGGPQEGGREARPEGPARRGTCPRGAEPVKRVLSREHQSKETGEMALCAAPPRPPAPRPASNQVQVQPNLGPTHPPRASNRRSYQLSGAIS
jgi:hypothetical protein